MTAISQTSTVQVYRVYIRATPEAVWTAITDRDWTDRYGYGGFIEYDGGELRAGVGFRVLTNAAMREQGAPDVAVDGEVLEADPPRKLVQSWRLAMDDRLAAEGFTRLTYEVEPTPGGTTRLTVTHDLTGTQGLAPLLAGEFDDSGAGGGWPWVLSGLKTVLETGASLDR